jgi:hypothetical protein
MSYIPNLCINNIIYPITTYIYYKHVSSSTTMTIRSTLSMYKLTNLNIVTRMTWYPYFTTSTITGCTIILLHNEYVPLIVKYSIGSIRSILQFYVYILGNNNIVYILSNCIYGMGTLIRFTTYTMPRISCIVGIVL